MPNFETLAPLFGPPRGPRAEALAASPWRRVVYDSRQAGPGDLFVALPGTRVDGHGFLAAVTAAGASAAIVSEAYWNARGASAPLPVYVVADTRTAMARAAAELYGHPSRRLKLVGVTGTNGKTTTTHLVRAVLEAAGVPTGILGTLGAAFAGHLVPTGHTTPQAVELQHLLAQMADAGMQACTLEASSHAIEQGRVFGCAFEVAVFTNLTQDHLDYHGTMAAYEAVKKRLFTWRATGTPPAHAVINLDDPAGASFARAAEGPVITYGIEAGPAALLWASDIESFAAGSHFRVHWQDQVYPVSLPLPGRFNLYNALAAFGSGLALGIAPDQVAAALARVPGVPGRVEVVTPMQHPFTAWVDYAHTPDGLVNVLQAARAVTRGRVIALFGCGGDRDRGKRPLMGQAASAWADLVIVTSDNPRSEDPGAIVAEIAPGLSGAHEVILDRDEAIARAIALAEPGDVVVIAGKGHETTQTFADRTIHFDDREVARRALARRAERPC